MLEWACEGRSDFTQPSLDEDARAALRGEAEPLIVWLQDDDSDDSEDDSEDKKEKDAKPFPSQAEHVVMMRMINNSVDCLVKNAILLRSLVPGGAPSKEEKAQLAEMDGLPAFPDEDGNVRGRRGGKRRRGADRCDPE